MSKREQRKLNKLYKNSKEAKYFAKEKKQQHTLVDLRGSNNVIPGAIRVILPYTEVLNRNPGGVSDDYQFNLNSLFDPNRTGTGHQPLGFDQYTAFYNRYRVMALRYDITVSNNSTSALFFAVAPTNSTTSLDLLNVTEQPMAKRAQLAGSAGYNVARIEGIVSLPLLNGRSVAEYRGSTNTEATMTTSPAEALLLHVFGGSMDASVVNYSLVVRMYFDTILFDRVELSES